MKKGQCGEGEVESLLVVAAFIALIWWIGGGLFTSSNQTKQLEASLQQANSNIQALDAEIDQANQDISDTNQSIYEAINISDIAGYADAYTLQTISDTFDTYPTVTTTNSSQ